MDRAELSTGATDAYSKDHPKQGDLTVASGASQALRFVETPDARLAVFEEGSSGDTLLLLHGGPGVPDYLQDVAGILAAGHRVVRFDQRGTGQSLCRSGNYALTDYVDDVDAIRRALGLERLKLFGHSWGGLVAQLYATRYPDRVLSLCLCSSSIGLGSDWRAMERAVMAHNRRRSGLPGFMLLGVDQLLAMLPGRVGDRSASRMMARVWRNYFDPPDSAPVPSPQWLAGVRSRPIFETRRAALATDRGQLRVPPSIPMLITFGQDDIYGRSTERLIARYPSARAVLIPDCGHVPWIQNRRAFEAVIASFFQGNNAV